MHCRAESAAPPAPAPRTRLTPAPAPPKPAPAAAAPAASSGGLSAGPLAAVAAVFAAGVAFVSTRGEAKPKEPKAAAGKAAPKTAVKAAKREVSPPPRAAAARSASPAKAGTRSVSPAPASRSASPARGTKFVSPPPEKKPGLLGGLFGAGPTGTAKIQNKPGTAKVAAKPGTAKVAARPATGTAKVAVKAGTSKIAAKPGTAKVAVKPGTAKVATRPGTAKVAVAKSESKSDDGSPIGLAAVLGLAVGAAGFIFAGLGGDSTTSTSTQKTVTKEDQLALVAKLAEQQVSMHTLGSHWHSHTQALTGCLRSLGLAAFEPGYVSYLIAKLPC